MKKTETNLRILLVIFVISLVIANVVGARVVTAGLAIGSIALSMSGGALTYAFTFLCTDIVGEIWGKAEAKRFVRYGFLGQIFATVMIVLTGYLPPTDMAMDAAYHTLLGQNWVFVIGSLCAYAASQSWDVFIFHKIRDRHIARHGCYTGSGRWIWNNLSTGTSQIIDTALYALISYGFGFGWLWNPEMHSTLIGIMIGQYLLKLCLALLDTPFFYFFTRRAHEGGKPSAGYLNY